MTKAAPLTSWHAARSAGDGGTRVFNREWRAHGEAVKSAPDYAVTIPPTRTTRLLSADQVAEIRASELSNVALAALYGRDKRLISDVRVGRADGKPEPTAPLVLLCMDPDELAEWHRRNETAASYVGGRAATPCEDCLLAFALEMRAIKRCNGTPGAAADVEDQDEPETPAEEKHMATVQVLITAPCETCAHEPVCGRKAAIDTITSVGIERDPMPKGLSMVFSAAVDCDAYMRLKGSHATPTAVSSGKRQFSPEGLAHIRENAVKAREAQREAKLGNVSGQPIRQLETVESAG